MSAESDARDAVLEAITRRASDKTITVKGIGELGEAYSNVIFGPQGGAYLSAHGGKPRAAGFTAPAGDES